MQLVAKKGGDADGAFGNGWQIRADRSSSWDPNKAIDIDVFVSTKDRRIVVRYVNGSPKFADLKAELEANSTVNSLFEVKVDNVFAGDPATDTDLDDLLVALGVVDDSDAADGFDKITTVGPTQGNTVDVDADAPGIQRSDTGNKSVANGYGDNAAATNPVDPAENDFNYGSKARITRSSSVTP